MPEGAVTWNEDAGAMPEDQHTWDIDPGDEDEE